MDRGRLSYGRLLPHCKMKYYKMKRLFTILSIVLAFASASFAQNYTHAQVNERINSVASKMKHLQCDFVQTKTISMLKSKVQSQGKMYYAQLSKLRWEYTSPYRYTFILNGQTVLLKNKKGNSQIDVNQSKMFKEITRIMMSSVLGTCVSNNRDFNVVLRGSGKNWEAVLTPKKSPMKQMFKTITVYFDMNKSMVSGVKMTEKNGDTTTIILKNVKINSAINANVFSLH